MEGKEMEPKYQKAYAIEGIAQKWVGDNEEDYVDTGDMLDDFKQILELSRELMKMLRASPKEALQHCLSEVANIIELVECLDDFDGLAVKEAVDKLNELVVYIAGQLKTPAQRKVSEQAGNGNAVI